MNNKFKKVCKKDVEEIYNTINPYLPRFDVFNLNQSVIYEKQKTLVCKAIRNDSKEIIGRELTIKLFDVGEIYILKDEENSLFLKRIYSDIREEVMISLESNNLKRCFSYTHGDSTLSIQEEYDLNYKIENYRYNNSDSIKENINVLKSKNKVRKRT